MTKRSITYLLYVQNQLTVYNLLVSNLDRSTCSTGICSFLRYKFQASDIIESYACWVEQVINDSLLIINIGPNLCISSFHLSLVSLPICCLCTPIIVLESSKLDSLDTIDIGSWSKDNACQTFSNQDVKSLNLTT